MPLDDMIDETAVEVEFFADDFESIRTFLKDDEVKLLTFKYIYGYSNEEISKALGISYTNCSTKIKRIKDKFKKNYFNL